LHFFDLFGLFPLLGSLAYELDPNPVALTVQVFIVAFVSAALFTQVVQTLSALMRAEQEMNENEHKFSNVTVVTSGFGQLEHRARTSRPTRNCLPGFLASFFIFFLEMVPSGKS
jgi:hypothetical protein